MRMNMLDMMPFLRLHRLLNLALSPVSPRPEYRAWLRQKLVSDAARLRMAQHSAMAGRFGLAGRRGILVGALLGSLISLAGLVALFLTRHGAGAQPSRPAA